MFVSTESPGGNRSSFRALIALTVEIPSVSMIISLWSVISYSRGNAATVKSPISLQYPLVEGVTALISFFFSVKFGTLRGVIFSISRFIASLIVITVIDLHHQIIPDVISLPGIGIGLLASFILPHLTFLNSLMGVLLGGGSLFLVATLYQWLFKREGLGGGDVKLLAMIGAFLGWKTVILTILLSSLIGSITGIIIMVAKGKDFKYAIPFGPFLSLGAVISFFYGEKIITWYLYLNR